MSEGGSLGRLKALIDGIRVGLLTTVDLDGSLHTRSGGTKNSRKSSYGFSDPR